MEARFCEYCSSYDCRCYEDILSEDDLEEDRTLDLVELFEAGLKPKKGSDSEQ